MGKDLKNKMVSIGAQRDQAVAFIKDNSETIAQLATSCPDALVRCLADFALSEVIHCPIIDFVENAKVGD